eukprot:GHUV01042037.1.p1 GENE.GHUV01042037.1~~GHUV01042037.1.p1  ORF type:complete len:113 (+),score=16.05 GHUV01042037.1:417-755(+)
MTAQQQQLLPNPWWLAGAPVADIAVCSCLTCGGRTQPLVTFIFCRTTTATCPWSVVTAGWSLCNIIQACVKGAGNLEPLDCRVDVYITGQMYVALLAVQILELLELSAAHPS